MEIEAYRVGAPDPTTDPEEVDAIACAASLRFVEVPESVVYCTWLAAHPGVPHVAGTGTEIVAVWW